MTAALEGGDWSAESPGRTLLPGKTRYPIYRRVGGPQGRSGRAKNLVPTGIRSRTVQPVSVTIPTELPGPHYFICTLKLMPKKHLVQCRYTSYRQKRDYRSPVCIFHLLCSLVIFLRVGSSIRGRTFWR